MPEVTWLDDGVMLESRVNDRCTWAEHSSSRSSASVVIKPGSDRATIRVHEYRHRPDHTKRTTITIDREEAIAIIKMLSRLL